MLHMEAGAVNISTPGIQECRYVPVSGTYSIEALGGQGGRTNSTADSYRGPGRPRFMENSIGGSCGGSNYDCCWSYKDIADFIGGKLGKSQPVALAVVVHLFGLLADSYLLSLPAAGGDAVLL